jgi:FkbM family methyltransferase
MLRRFDIHVFRTLPRGVSVTHDLKRAMPDGRFRLVFDVGANIGQSTRRYMREFPEARIVSFEPSSRHFAQLIEEFSPAPRVTCEQLALGSAEGEATLVETLDPTMYHLAKHGAARSRGIAAVGAEQVPVTTVDRYCAQRGIDYIDFLKIDTEGHDYEVIVGAEDMLTQERVGALQCECGVSPENTFHVGFDTLRSHLEIKGYRLFGIYEQVHEWIAHTPNLRRVNAVYVSKKLLHAGAPDQR